MYKLQGKMIGVAPILFERLLDEAREQIDQGKNTPRLTREQKIQQAYLKVYRQDGHMGVPSKNAKKCLLEGSRMLKQKRQRSGLWRYLRGAVFFSEDFLPFAQKEPDLIHEDTARIPPGPKGVPCTIFRPALRKGWELPFILMVYDDTIPEGQIKEALEYAGLMVGICGYRPDYGRFRVEWEDNSE